MRCNVLALGALLLLGFCCLWTDADIDDPYRILGIGKKASLPEIRKAYKRLAKEWYVAVNSADDRAYFCARIVPLCLFIVW